jgi:hypothetical protein
MSEELQDELTSINSIYEESTLVPLDVPSVYALSLPARPSVSLRIEFPTDYPDAPPSVLGTQSVGSDVAKGEGNQLVELVRDILAEVYTPGAPCIFEIIEESGQRLQQLGLDAGSTEDQGQQTSETNGQPTSFEQDQHGSSDDLQPLEELGDPPPWIISEVITEKKSVFVARAAAVASVDQAKQYLAHLLATDKKVAKATHNITAWRIQGENGVQYQDCDDDGETAAGGRVLHLLELMGVWNVMVVVTRWYGGIHLGPDRFRIINQAARDAVVKGSFAQDTGKEATKKRGKK